MDERIKVDMKGRLTFKELQMVYTYLKQEGLDVNIVKVVRGEMSENEPLGYASFEELRGYTHEIKGSDTTEITHITLWNALVRRTAACLTGTNPP